MGHHDNRVFKVNQKTLPAMQSHPSQMVCRLIKQQDIRITEQRLCKVELSLFSEPFRSAICA